MAKTPEEQLGVPLPEEHIEIPEPEVPPEAVPERPEGLPENYKTLEEFVESKKEIERRFHEEAGRRAEVEQRLQALEEQYAQPQEPQYSPEDQIAQVADQFGVDYEQAQAMIAIADWRSQQILQAQLPQYQQQIQQQFQPYQNVNWELMAAKVDEEMHTRYNDWDDKKNEIAEYMGQHPHVFRSEVFEQGMEPSIQLLDMAYKAVKSQELMGQAEELRQAGVSQADIDRARKMQARTVPGRSGSQEPPDPGDEWLARAQAARASGSYAAQMSQAKPA